MPHTPSIESLIDDVIAHEGDFVNHPADRGGPTRWGITEAVARAEGYSGAMRALPRETAADIYRRVYWSTPRFDQIAQLPQMPYLCFRIQRWEDFSGTDCKTILTSNIFNKDQCEVPI